MEAEQFWTRLDYITGQNLRVRSSKLGVELFCTWDSIFVMEISAGRELVRTTCIPLQLLFPVQFFQNPAHSLSGSLKYMTSFQSFTAFQNAFPWHATVFPYFTQNFSLERKDFLPRLLFSSVLLISLESELSPFNQALKSSGHKLNLALTSSWSCSYFLLFHQWPTLKLQHSWNYTCTHKFTQSLFIPAWNVSVGCV